jgi:hypothetical protein
VVEKYRIYGLIRTHYTNRNNYLVNNNILKKRDVYMLNSTNLVKNIISIVLFAIGAGLVIWGYKKSEGLGSQLSNTLTGSHSDNVMMLYIAGAASISVGVFLYFKKVIT